MEFIIYHLISLPTSFQCQYAVMSSCLIHKFIVKRSCPRDCSYKDFIHTLDDVRNVIIVKSVMKEDAMLGRLNASGMDKRNLLPVMRYESEDAFFSSAKEDEHKLFAKMGGEIPWWYADEDWQTLIRSEKELYKTLILLALSHKCLLLGHILRFTTSPAEGPTARVGRVSRLFLTKKKKELYKDDAAMDNKEALKLTKRVLTACDTMLEKAAPRFGNYGELPETHEDLLRLLNTKRELLDTFAKSLVKFSGGDDAGPSDL